MFEKPQYLTPDGYRRTTKNPYKKKPVIKSTAKKKGLPAKRILSPKNFQKQARRGISKEAAQLIAQAIRGMLHQ